MKEDDNDADLYYASCPRSDTLCQAKLNTGTLFPKTVSTPDRKWNCGKK